MAKNSYKKVYAAIILLLIISGLVGWRMYATWQQQRAVALEIEALEKEADEYKQANERLAERIQDLGSLASRERTAREELDMQRPGEIALRFPAPPPPPPPPEPENKTDKWWRYFFNY